MGVQSPSTLTTPVFEMRWGMTLTEFKTRSVRFPVVCVHF